MPKKKPGQEVERSFSGKCSLWISHVRAQLRRSRGGCTEPPPSFCLVPFNQDKSAHGMVKKNPKFGRNPQSRRCWVGREEKSRGLSRDQEGLSIGAQKKPRDMAEHIPALILGGKRSCYGSTATISCSKSHFFSGVAPSGKVHLSSDMPRAGGSPREGFLASALPSFLVRAKYCHNEARQDPGAGWVNPTIWNHPVNHNHG